MNHKELIERLESRTELGLTLNKEAADTIESLLAENERLTHEEKTMRSETATLSAAMYELARTIYSDDGVANAAIAEAAERLDEQTIALRRMAEMQTAMEFAFGCLWMIDPERSERAYAARQALVPFLDQPAKGRGIKAAIAAGFEADHPPGCDWWAGKKATAQ